MAHRWTFHSNAGVDVVRTLMNGLKISPILARVLGNRGINLVWFPTREDTVFFNPLRTFPQGSTMELYYEIYGLSVGTTYRTQLSVRKQGRGRAEITLSFTDPAASDVTRSRRTLDLSRLGRGDYLIDVVVTAADGRKTRQSREFSVVKESNH